MRSESGWQAAPFSVFRWRGGHRVFQPSRRECRRRDAQQVHDSFSSDSDLQLAWQASGPAAIGCAQGTMRAGGGRVCRLQVPIFSRQVRQPSWMPTQRCAEGGRGCHLPAPVRAGSCRVWWFIGVADAEMRKSNVAQRLPPGSHLQFALAGGDLGSHQGCRSRTGCRLQLPIFSSRRQASSSPTSVCVEAEMRRGCLQLPIFSSRWQASSLEVIGRAEAEML
jgi:hypothetical protein